MLILELIEQLLLILLFLLLLSLAPLWTCLSLRGRAKFGCRAFEKRRLVTRCR